MGLIPLRLSLRGVREQGLFLMCHDVENHAVGLVHALATYTRHVVNGAVDIVLNETFDRGDVLILNGKHGRENGGGNTT